MSRAERCQKIKEIKSGLSELETRWFDSYCAEFPHDDLNELMIAAKEKAAKYQMKSNKNNMKVQLSIPMLSNKLDNYCCRYQNIYSSYNIEFNFNKFRELFMRTAIKNAA